MKYPYQIQQEIEREEEISELKSIIDKPYLEPKEIWSMFPQNFYKWRVKHDFPRILKHFSEKLNGFEDWKREYNFTDEKLIAYGISNCISPNPAKDKRKFIVEKSNEKQKVKFISYQNLDGKYYNLGPNSVNHKVISTFTGYIDWCNSKKIIILPNRRSNELIGLYSKSRINSPDVSVSILDNLELLKIGGIDIKLNGSGLYKPKYFEFVNADYLSFSGRRSFVNSELIFENSFIDNFTCEDIELPLVEFRNCSIVDFVAKNSTLQQWLFALSSANGKFYNTDLRMVSVLGGSFNIDFKDCTFFNVDAKPTSKKDFALESTYRTFKRIYANQGEDKKAIEYFLLEKEIEREKIKNQIFNYQSWNLFTKTKYEKFVDNTIHTTTNLANYLSQCINNFYWGYGRKPLRVVRNSVIMIALFAIIYYFFQSNMSMPHSENSMTILDSLYYSTVTFTTLGYGDFAPIGYLRIASALEAFLGGISLGFLVAGFSNFKY